MCMHVMFCDVHVVCLARTGQARARPSAPRPGKRETREQQRGLVMRVVLVGDLLARSNEGAPFYFNSRRCTRPKVQFHTRPARLMSRSFGS